MSKRVALWTGGVAAIVAVVALRQAAVGRAENDEQYANELIRDANSPPGAFRDLNFSFYEPIVDVSDARPQTQRILFSIFLAWLVMWRV
jgi:hypothetical protein